MHASILGVTHFEVGCGAHHSLPPKCLNLRILDLPEFSDLCRGFEKLLPCAPGYLCRLSMPLRRHSGVMVMTFGYVREKKVYIYGVSGPVLGGFPAASCLTLSAVV